MSFLSVALSVFHNFDLIGRRYFDFEFVVVGFHLSCHADFLGFEEISGFSILLSALLSALESVLEPT